MKNNFKFLFLIVFFFLLILPDKLFSFENFNFDITQIEISENGNMFKGVKRGSASTKDGLIITADYFEYNKITNILKAKGNVKIVDNIKDHIILAEDITYLRNSEKIFTKGTTEAVIESKYNFKSKNVIYSRLEGELTSLNKTIVKDDQFTSYSLSEFKYNINKNLLNGSQIEVISDFSKSEKDRDLYFFENGIFNLQDKEFVASDTKLFLKKNIFDVEENDPRIFGVSSEKKGNITTINKAVFTSCNSDEKCPSWSITSNKIKHDLDKKQLIYDDAILKIYELPILYFPKFFHPDPSVKRQSGFLTPQINDSEILGTSIHIPYFHVVSEDKDLTFKPTVFDSNIYMINNEYRQESKNSSFIADFGHTRGFKSSLGEYNKKNSISHLFSKFTHDFNLDDFSNSKLEINFEKLNNDTYLKIFDTNLIDKKIKPSNQDMLTSNIKIDLDNEIYNFSSNIYMYENLSGTNSDRFQYIFPSYNFSTQLLSNKFGLIYFDSQGDNSLQNTNNLKTSVINNIEMLTSDIITKNGLINNFGIYFKNTNTLGKNDTNYKNSPQSEFKNIFNYEASIPLTKLNQNYYNYIIPKISLRMNPNEMKDYSLNQSLIDTSNVFSINRIGVSDSFEPGKSLTIGLDYKKESVKDINKYFDLKLATVLRDKNENTIPLSSSLNTKSSNLFGSTTYSLSDNFLIDYNFSIDNNFKNIEYNNFETQFKFSKFLTKFNFIEENGKIGSANSIENTTEINFNKNNFIYFNTRRNRETSLTEYYDLIYEYKNDCLSAGIKYKKTYYEDRDVLPNEDLLFTITLFPLTTYEQRVEQNLYRN